MSRCVSAVISKRDELGISQQVLAKKLGYTRGQFISNFERGLCPFPLNNVKKLCAVLKIDVNEFKQYLLEDYLDKLNKEIK